MSYTRIPKAVTVIDSRQSETGRRTLTVKIGGDLADQIVSIHEGNGVGGSSADTVRELLLMGIAATNPAEPQALAMIRAERMRVCMHARVGIMERLHKVFGEILSDIDMAYSDAKAATTARGGE